jgi:hypothetical protein
MGLQAVGLGLWTKFMWLRIGTGGGLSCSIKCMEFLDQLKTCYLLEDCASWSCLVGWMVVWLAGYVSCI